MRLAKAMSMPPQRDMRAWVQSGYGGVERLELLTVPRPSPGKGEVRVRVSTCGVNLSDWEFLTGSPFYARLAGGFVRPWRSVLGSDIVGEIDALGEGVEGWKTGERVMGDFVMTRGGFAEYAIVKAAYCNRVPLELSDEVAAALPQSGGIALAGVAGAENGVRFLINGAGGGAGPIALHLAKARGAIVTCVDRGDKLDYLTHLGADQVIDYETTDFAGTGQKWDLILDLVATRSAQTVARALAESGRYQAVGGSVSTLLSLMGGSFFYRAGGRQIGVLAVPSSADVTADIARRAVSGELKPLLDDVFPLERCDEAIAKVGAGAARGKVVVKV